MSASSVAPVAIERRHRKVPVRQRLFERWRRPLFAVIDLVVIVLAWEFVVNVAELVQPLFLPPPGEVLSAARELWASGELLANLRLSAQNWFFGYVAGGALGILLGLLVGSIATVHRLSMPLLWAAWATPLIALQPIITAWFGFGAMPIIVLVFISTVVPVALNTATGVSGVDSSLLRAGRVFGAGRTELYRKVRLPWTLPYAIGGLRMAIPTSLIGLLVGEMIGSPTGLGAMIVTSVARFRTDQTIAVVVVFVILSVVLVSLLDAVEQRVGRWRNSGTHG
ncbi:ABC transporter permease [Phytoactinopolyspora limicola]|uniref:ABC transporter permease n=1 Tax=Phytoactinopolyspora limicola TaxID=2715536 RepID=UPI00140A9DE5|nr:ABC transporter permease [Phytoactinopolyspora limicola]